MTAASFDLEHFRYYIGNPSAWESYDDAMSERMRSAAGAIEAQQARIEELTNALGSAANLLHQTHTTLTALASGFYAEEQTELSAAMAGSASEALNRFGGIPEEITAALEGASLTAR